MRTIGSKGEVTQGMLREAGVRLIAEHGYEAVTLRMLAKEVGIQAGSLYNYIANKQEFLFDLLSSIIHDNVDEMVAALDGLTDPEERLRAFVRAHIIFHTRRKSEVFIGNMELRSLTPENFEAVRRLRDAYEAILAEILEDGAKVGRFRCDDVELAKLAILNLLTGIATWYRPDGRYSIDELVRRYTDMTFALLRAETAVSV
ncbi:TetR/AcrR family transcriptional regulator [Amorphus sp. 3PC139-8]|uniref:TetR/AcrR family transcriptional regulator n=1 Tax=Amorphus sp. 3PC139-8 TaxID=2735676 RepID=UPI00345D558C